MRRKIRLGMAAMLIGGGIGAKLCQRALGTWALARVAGVKRRVLDHIVPPLPLRFGYPAFLGRAHDHVAGPITAGEDGMMFGLPVGSGAITEKDLL